MGSNKRKYVASVIAGAAIGSIGTAAGLALKNEKNRKKVISSLATAKNKIKESKVFTNGKRELKESVKNIPESLSTSEAS